MRIKRKELEKAIAAAMASIAPVMIGQSGAMQGTILAHLVAIWLAGYPRATRAEALAHFLTSVTEMIGPVERAFFADKDAPKNGRQ